MAKAHESMGDEEFLDHVNEVGIDGIIAEREQHGERLAQRYSDLPKGLTWVEFLLHREIADLDLDFITAHQMFAAYRKQD
jgi:hypothetical protein